MNAVVIGAGNIGRGFLGDLLNRTGCSITFIDTDQEKIDLLNKQKQYSLVSVSKHGSSSRVVNNISAISIFDEDRVIPVIVGADIILTAVGKIALSKIAPVLARGLEAKRKYRPKSQTGVVVVACENVLGNTQYLKEQICLHLDQSLHADVFDSVSFPNCVVDRIVPNLPPPVVDDPLSVTVEDYFQLAVDGTMLSQEPLPIFGMDIATNLEAVLVQKLCTLNMAHAIAAYFGSLSGFDYIHEAVGHRHIRALIEGALGEVSLGLTIKFPSLEPKAQQEYAKKVLDRFDNQNLPDTIGRVAREPVRKLGQYDRLVYPALLAIEQQQMPVCLAAGIAAVFHYQNQEDAQSVLLSDSLRQHGIKQVIHSYCGLDESHLLNAMIASNYLFRAI